MIQKIGELDSSDRRLSDNSSFDEYTFVGFTGQNILIQMFSHEFDTYLLLLDHDNQMLESNDDLAPGNTNSQIFYTVPSDGIYRVFANSFNETGAGNYLLDIRQLE